MKLFHHSAVFVAGLSLFAACQEKANHQTKQTEKEENPIKNVVVIISDDHSYKTLGCYGNMHIKTPNIDKIANQGVLFENAYSQSPISAPSRQSMLSGKYPHSTGVSLVFTPFPDSPNTTIAEVLKKKDYATCLIGKTHFNNFFWWDLYKDGFPSYGFDTLIEKREYKKWLDQNPMPEIPDSIQTRYSNSAGHKNTEYLPQAAWDDYAVGTFYARQGVKFIEQNKDNPFFLWLAFHEPHAPFNFPIEYANKYNPDDLPLVQAGPEDERWIPEMFRRLTEKERRGIVASYYTSVDFMDKNVGIILDALNSKYEILL